MGQTMEGALVVTDQSFAHDVLESPLPVAVDFGAEWCPPCRVIEPIMAELAAEYAGRMLIAKVDIDSNPRYASQLGIRSAPTLIIFHQGREIERLVGARRLTAYRASFDAALLQQQD